MKFQPPRGMKDIEEDEMFRREYIYGKIVGVLKRYGFRFVEASALENIETLAVKAGPEIENEIYCFKDKSDRKIALRFDLTVGIARMVASNKRPKPIKIACISNVWRYDRPQFARYRSFWQWDAEIFGVAGMEADAEIIAATYDILKSFSLDFEIRVNSRKLIEGFLVDIGVKEKNLLLVLRAIDKTAKLSKTDMLAEFKKYGIKKPQAEKILELCSRRGGIEILENFEVPDNKLAKDGLRELKELFNYLKAYNKADNCMIDFSIVRGIDYYTGIVYEAWIKNEKKPNDDQRSSSGLGAVAGGGRFDNLVGLYGDAMPATGIAGGIERLLLSLEKKIPEDRIERVPKILVVYTSNELFEKALQVLQKIRRSTPADIDMLKRNLRKQMDYANSKGIPYIVLVGQQELDRNSVKLKNMASGEESEVSMDDLENEIKKLE